MSMFYWFGIEIDIYPYFKEKQQQGLIWSLTAAQLSASVSEPWVPLRSWVSSRPTFTLETHAGTFYRVLLPYVKKSKLIQRIGCDMYTKRWSEEREVYQICEPYEWRNLPNTAKMSIKIRLRFPKSRRKL